MVLRSTNRPGTIIPMMAVCVTVLFGFVALAIDLGMVILARSAAQNAADTAALTGARTLDNRVPIGTLADNYDNQRDLALANAQASVVTNSSLNNNMLTATSVQVGIYDYDPDAQVFRPSFPEAKPTGKAWTSVEVNVAANQPSYFSRVFGVNSLPTSARAVAAHRPRDIALVLDMSGSMKFASTYAWPPGTASSTGTVSGLLNPDPVYPRFGHYERYPTTSIPNAFMRDTQFIAGTNEVFAPTNMSMDVEVGPAIVRQFVFDPSNLSNPSNPVATVTNASLLRNAFHRWNPPGMVPLTSSGVFGRMTSPTGWAGYNAFDTTNTSGPTPAPTSWADQSDADAPYVGDRYPRKGGVVRTDSTSWNPSTSTGAARHLRDLLNLGSASSNYIDSIWESNTDTGGYGVNFKGFSMGPGYYGKTFFMWPPDPRWGGGSAAIRPDLISPTNPAKDIYGNWIADWRRRFFLRDDSADTGTVNGDPNSINQSGSWRYFHPAGDNDISASGTQNINQALLGSSTGHTLRGATSGSARSYRVNYRAVLAWIKSGPQVLPPNLRAGRIKFYSSIPDHVDNAGRPGSNESNLDQRFWREYIDYVLGYMENTSSYDPRYMLAGVETSQWGSANVSINSTSANNGTFPYMNYNDVPARPRLHFWFGPMSMLMFISGRDGTSGLRNWNPGTVAEAQTWQLKAGVRSSLDDIRNNHPNDQVGMAYFAGAYYTTARADMGQDWDTLKNALYYPKSLLAGIKSGSAPNAELRPYTSSLGDDLVGDLPNANGGTDPNSGFVLAYNLLSSASAINGTGRRGATKIVIFETDGVPNTWRNFAFTPAGANSYYTFQSSTGSGSNGNSTSISKAFDVIDQIVAPTASNGYSLENSDARVYPIAFGDLFSSTSTFKGSALNFLQEVAYRGKTSQSASTPLPSYQIIVGTADERIDSLRSSFERILQSGVQVTLIE